LCAQGFVGLVCGQLLALLSSLGGGISAHIREENTSRACFSKCEACFLSNSTSALDATRRFPLAE
jgi:hypothetical protein